MTGAPPKPSEPAPARAAQSEAASSGNGELSHDKRLMAVTEFLSAFATADGSRDPAWLQPRRLAARARAAELGFPDSGHEEWRFTSVAPILQLPLHPAPAAASALTAAQIAPFTFGLDGWRLVFVDGHFCAELSALPEPDSGVRAGSLRQALAVGAPELEPHLARGSNEEENVFTALNTAFFQDGAFVAVAPGKVVEQPIHLLFLRSNAEPGATTHLRNLILAGARSELKVLETYESLAGGPTFTNAVTELELEKEARLDHCKVQEENRHAFHIAAILGRQDRASHLTSHSISTGARLARNQIQTLFRGENGVCVLNGLYLAHGDQRVDHHTVVDHAQPRCESHEYYHGVLAGRARGVFNGKILVRQDAQKTNAKQTNRNLLLSDEAVIDTKPQLEIFADDVKCTHGATVGQLDEEAIFYLRSRGIGLERARQIMVRAFASDVVKRIPLEPVRARLNQMLGECFKD